MFEKFLLRHPKVGGRIGAVCGFFLGLSAVINGIMNYGWQGQDSVGSMVYVPALSYFGFVIGTIVWTYTPLGSDKFAFSPAKLTLKDRVTGMLAGIVFGVFFGFFGAVQKPMIGGASTAVFGSAFAVPLTSAVCGILGFIFGPDALHP